mmetsp:Transcript_3939/g.6632  ORF Transcript_3939/g.6632 Transcript_3939/m.6632 type:complete len:225 (-) Transcript_3939:1305-1979(-)
MAPLLSRCSHVLSHICHLARVDAAGTNKASHLRRHTQLERAVAGPDEMLQLIPHVRLRCLLDTAANLCQCRGNSSKTHEIIQAELKLLQVPLQPWSCILWWAQVLCDKVKQVPVVLQCEGLKVEVQQLPQRLAATRRTHRLLVSILFATAPSCNPATKCLHWWAVLPAHSELLTINKQHLRLCQGLTQVHGSRFWVSRDKTQVFATQLRSIPAAQPSQRYPSFS